jgi:peptidoglycan hydrolase-like protein with peptidoglycan-binding domain
LAIGYERRRLSAARKSWSGDMLRHYFLLAASALILALAVPAPTMAQDSTGMAAPYSVSDIQQKLSDLGYDAGPVDGVIGPKTRGAIRAYQTDAGLPVTGEPDAAFLESLNYRSVEIITDPALILRIENGLDRLGYAVGPIDGTVDHQLGMALSNYTQFAGLPVNHLPIMATLAHIEAHEFRNNSQKAAKLIWDVETELTRRGYEIGPMDGTLDLRTIGAIRDYEDDTDRRPKGKVDASLVDSLGLADRRPVTPEDIGEIERRLNLRGYAAGAADGVADAQTASAIKAYQADAGLAATGEPTVILLEDLRRSLTFASNDSSP